MDKKVTVKEEQCDFCFFITPIGEASSPIRRKTDGLYDSVIGPVMKDPKVNMDLIVAHRKHTTGDISTGIVSDIFNAKLVIADLSTLNPNVMYEVAIRDCLKKPIILIAEEGTVLPFDVQMMNTIRYKNDFQGVKDLKEELLSKIVNINFEKYQADNLLTKAKISMDLYNDVNKLHDPELKGILNSILLKIQSLDDSVMEKSILHSREAIKTQKSFEILLDELSDFAEAKKDISNLLMSFEMEYRITKIGPHILKIDIRNYSLSDYRQALEVLQNTPYIATLKRI